jgi:hypothetical protein
MEDPLEHTPDPGLWNDYVAWFETLRSRAGSIPSDAELRPVEGTRFAAPTNPYGCFASADFRRFLGATLAADWLTYQAPDDRATLPRLVFVLERFPKGFRTWFARTHDARWLPVGYSAWYPIDAPTFDRFVKNEPPWRDRAVVPLTQEKTGDHLYLFNYSILPQFRRGAGSRELLQHLAADLALCKSNGLVAITVSDDGARVAHRFGLSHRHEIVVGDSREQIWVSGC